MIFTVFEFTENLSSTGWLSAGTLPAITLEGTIEEGPGFNVTAPALTLEATSLTGETATIAQTLPVLTLEATAQQEPYADITAPAMTLESYIATGWTFAVTMPSWTSEITVITGGVTTVEETVPVFTAEIATGADARLDLPLPTLDAAAQAGNLATCVLALPLPTIEAVNVQTVTTIFAATLPLFSIEVQAEPGTVTTVAVSLLVHTLSSTGLSGSVSTLLEALPALESEASMLWAGSATVDQTLPALQALAVAIQVTTDALGTPQAWVLNLRNLGLTEYTNWAFNSMTYFNGKYIGASEAGIIELGVQDHEDGTTDIPARFRTGKHGMDSSFLKRVPYGYLECEADGDVLVSTLTSEDGQRDYLVPWNSNTEVQNRRVNFGRGPKSKHWQFEFANREGSHFRIVALDSLPRRSHRRVQ